MVQDALHIGLGHTPLKQKIDWFFAGRGMGVNPHTLMRSRLGDIIDLESKTDRELAEIGLRREDILPFVFRDVLSA